VLGRSTRKSGGDWSGASGREVSRAPKGLWAVVRELTPAEGLAVVCLASWAHPESGLAQVSDRQVCSETGVSRDVMKRLRRKLATMGIAVTPGNNLSHDSCSYDLGTILDAEPRSQAWLFTRRVENAVGPWQGGLEELRRQPAGGGWEQRAAWQPPSSTSARQTGLGAPGLGAVSTEGQGAKSAQPVETWVQDLPFSEVPYDYLEVSLERARAGLIPVTGTPAVGAAARHTMPAGDTGAIPQSELTSCPPTAPLWAGGPSIAINLPGYGLNAAEAPAPRTLPPYEAWLARR
jgi:hypothetical protein